MDFILSEDFKPWIPLVSVIVGALVTSIIAIISWFIVHWLTEKRDQKNARRNTRVDALTECYVALVRSGIKNLYELEDDKINRQIADDVEKAILIIHLYGSPEQSKLANEYSKHMSEDGNANLDELVESLRKDIRGQLGEKEIIDKPTYFQFTTKK
ncbi:hypothetical protein [Acinetobacter baumannii]|uniref:hypothetical protein n=1 Tax=Acinetobacter baumannii TaxID=470 RepID=UPI00217DCBD0|nr:hypothetical protein [Acinetobacter baumannii]HEE5436307.1 hypothetical protein [Acinetobacter baumannii]